MVYLTKPEWVAHGEAGIYSLSASGDRLATGGGDQKVRVWALDSVLDDSDQAKPRLLATLADHFGSVNVVRFSPDGRLLASGSDDKAVLIYKLEPSSSGAAPPRGNFGSSDPPPLENWKLCQTLKNHTADVTDVAWDARGEMLATASIDNTAAVWAVPPDAGLAGFGGGMSRPWQMLASLTQHTGYVKGVAFDPVGKFLATQSDDRSVILWHTEDWTPVKQVKGYFDKCFGNSFALRCGWSPDGQILAATLGFNVAKHCAVFLSRAKLWQGDHHVIGHKAPVVVVRFNPFLYAKKDEQGVMRRNQVFAMGSQDCRVTVWSSGAPRPLMVLKKAFSKTVVDLAWSADGRTLLCASLDGTILAAAFDPSELGEQVNAAEMGSLLRGMYGEHSVGAQRGATQLAEDPLVLRYEAAAGASHATPIASPMAPSPASASRSSGGPPPAAAADAAAAPQVVYRGQDGKKRIIAQRLEGTLDSAASFGGAPPPAPPAAAQQSFTITADGKRRITAMAVGITPRGAGLAQAGSQQPPSQASQWSNPPQSYTQYDAPVAAQPVVQYQYQYAPVALHSVDAGGMPPVQPLMAPQPGAKVVATLTTTAGGAVAAEPAVVELTNREAHAGLRACVVSVRRGRHTLWKDAVGAAATLAAATDAFVAVALATGVLMVWTAEGRRALPPIQLPAPCAFLAAAAPHQLLAVCCNGALLQWDIKQQACVLQETVAPVLAAAAAAHTTVRQIRLSNAGLPLAVLGNRTTLGFDPAMRCWLRLADDAFVGSAFASTYTLGAGGTGAELAAMQVAALQGAVRPLMSALVGDDAPDQRALTRRHLESMVAATKALQAPAEYTRWLAAYARHLTMDSDEAALRELCMELLGPTRAVVGDQWAPTTMGLSKRALLRQHVLPAIGANRAVQRLLGELNDLLHAAEERDAAR